MCEKDQISGQKINITIFLDIFLIMSTYSHLISSHLHEIRMPLHHLSGNSCSSSTLFKVECICVASEGRDVHQSMQIKCISNVRDRTIGMRHCKENLKIQTKSGKYINFQIRNLNNSNSFYNISMRQISLSCIFRELSNDTKYIVV